jgi:hypothetical protein
MWWSVLNRTTNGLDIAGTSVLNSGPVTKFDDAKVAMGQRYQRCWRTAYSTVTVYQDSGDGSGFQPVTYVVYPQIRSLLHRTGRWLALPVQQQVTQKINLTRRWFSLPRLT